MNKQRLLIEHRIDENTPVKPYMRTVYYPKKGGPYIQYNLGVKGRKVVQKDPNTGAVFVLIPAPVIGKAYTWNEIVDELRGTPTVIFPLF